MLQLLVQVREVLLHVLPLPLASDADVRPPVWLVCQRVPVR
jgi:hypothetical protein